MKKKTNPELAEAIFIAKKVNPKLAAEISGPTRNQAKINLGEIEKNGEPSVIIPGKVLSSGELTKKVKIYALGFSEAAKEKIRSSGSEMIYIYDALKKGDKIEGKILK